MYIPKFYLPSRPDVSVQFKRPDLESAMYFCKSKDFTEERDTTEYLNMHQDKENRLDPLNWTASDRRTALWWIYINSTALPVQDYGYVCGHCGEQHWNNVNMHDLADELDVLAVDPFIQATVTVKGQPYEWLLKPLDGHAMERLERMRQMLPPRSKEDDYKQAVAELRVWELTYQAHLFYDLEPDYDKSAQTRYELIKQLEFGTELVEMAAKVRMMQQELQHGLNVVLDKGESMLILPPHQCQSEAFKEAAERPSTRLLVPFRSTQLIPDPGTGSLASISQQPGLVWGTTSR